MDLVVGECYNYMYHQYVLYYSFSDKRVSGCENRRLYPEKRAHIGVAFFSPSFLSSGTREF